MTKYLHQVLVIILAGLVLSTDAQNVHNPFFYHKGELRCNCEPNQQCDEKDGTCQGDICAHPYIGKNCQHANISLSMSKSPNNIPYALLDGNDSTCVGHWNETLTFDLDRTHLIWIYMFGKYTAPVQPHISLNDSGYVYTQPFGFDFWTLNNKYWFLIKPCNTKILYEKLIVSSLPDNTCSLEVSLGRNLAMSSRTHIRSNNLNQALETLKVVDGDDLHRSTSPFEFEVRGDTGRHWFEITFSHDAIINRVSVLSDAGSTCGDWKFIVQFRYSTQRWFSNEVKEAKITPSTKEASVNMDIEREVKKLKFNFERKWPDLTCTNVTEKIKVYEIYIFGEFVCKRGKYGGLCENPVPGTCTAEMCDPDWGCPSGCNQAWMSSWCKEKPSTTTAAPTASTPKDCRFRYGGDDCEYLCSDGCAGLGECDNRTGECVHGCNRGYNPPFCTTKCPPGYYDLNCSRSCIHCGKNRSTNEYACDPTSGECLVGCGYGYGGDYCEKLVIVDDQLTTVYSYSLGVYIVIIIILFYKSLTRKEDESVEEENRGQAEEMKEEEIVKQVVVEVPVVNHEDEKHLFLEQTDEAPLVSKQADNEPIISKQDDNEPLISKQADKEPLVSKQADKEPLISKQDDNKPLVSKQADKEPLVSKQADKEPLDLNKEAPLFVQEVDEKPPEEVSMPMNVPGNVSPEPKEEEVPKMSFWANIFGATKEPAGSTKEPTSDAAIAAGPVSAEQEAKGE